MIKVYAIDKQGDGHVMEIGTYDTIEDITLHIGMFDKDVVITFEETNNKEK